MSPYAAPGELDDAENAAAVHVATHPGDEPLLAAACEMLAMKRQSIGLYGPSPRPHTPTRG